MSATITRRTRLAAALAALFTSFGLLFGVLAPAADAANGPGKEEQIFARLVVGPGLDINGAQVTTIAEAGYLVCEGFTAEVPMTVMTGTLMQAYGFTGQEARHLANVAGQYLCH